MAYKIDNAEVPVPRSFTCRPLYRERETVLASGLLAMDRIATKRVFSLYYEWISGTDLLIFLDAIDDGFFEFTFENEAGVEQTATVKAERDTPVRRLIAAADEYYYGDVMIGLIER